AIGETRFVEPHLRGKTAEDLGIWQRLAERRNRGVIRERVEMAVTRVNVRLLELCRRRQQNIGVIGGVGLENLVDDAKQVFAQETLRDFRGVGRDGGATRVGG